MKIDIKKLTQLLNKQVNNIIVNDAMYILDKLWNQSRDIDFSRITEESLKITMDHIYYYVTLEDEQEDDDNANNLLEMFFNIHNIKEQLILAPPKGGVLNESAFI